jgi:hypothetical protein
MLYSRSRDQKIQIIEFVPSEWKLGDSKNCVSSVAEFTKTFSAAFTSQTALIIDSWNVLLQNQTQEELILLSKSISSTRFLSAAYVQICVLY